MGKNTLKNQNVLAQAKRAPSSTIVGVGVVTMLPVAVADMVLQLTRVQPLSRTVNCCAGVMVRVFGYASLKSCMVCFLAVNVKHRTKIFSKEEEICFF